MKPLSHLTRLTFFSVVLICAAAAVSAAELFQSLDSQAIGKSQQRPDPNALRSRFVRVDSTLLGVDAREGAGELIANLFPDAEVVLVLEKLLKRSYASYTWMGKIKDQSASSVTIAVEEGAFAGDIVTQQGSRFLIWSRPGGLHEIIELDSTKLPRNMDCVRQRPAEPISSKAAIRPNADIDTPIDGDDGSVQDLLVLYTANLLASYGGLSGLTAALNLDIDWTNQAYANSQIPVTLRVAHAEQTAYVESPDPFTDLTRLTDPADGFMDNAVAVRNAHRCDLVTLARTGNSGVGWLSIPSENGEFSISGGLIPGQMAHEIGHNQGCCHARTDPGGCSAGAFTYSVGHRFNGLSGTQWHTIMAYDPGTQIQHFSNPEVLFDNAPTGIPVGQTNEANNALTIARMAKQVANGRESLASTQFLVDKPEPVVWEGPVGGPFTPAGCTAYTIQNLAPIAQPWTASASQNWISVTPEGGSIPSANSTVAQACINAPNASALPAGVYEGTVKFESALPGISRTRNFFLFVGQSPVVFADANLEAAVRAALLRPAGNLYPALLQTPTTLTASGANIQNLDGLEHCTGLTVLDLGNNNITDISPLGGLTELTTLYLLVNNISDLAPLAGLTKMVHLLLYFNPISDGAPLANLTQLYSLYVSFTNLSDIGFMEGLTNLGYLDIRDNSITDLAPLVQNAGLAQNDRVDAGNNPLSCNAIQIQIPALEARGVMVTADAICATPTPTPTPYNGRPFGDFDNSGCTDLSDFLIMLDVWNMNFPGGIMGLADFLNLLDNWQLGAEC